MRDLRGTSGATFSCIAVRMWGELPEAIADAILLFGQMQIGKVYRDMCQRGLAQSASLAEEPFSTLYSFIIPRLRVGDPNNPSASFTP